MRRKRTFRRRSSRRRFARKVAPDGYMNSKVYYQLDVVTGLADRADIAWNVMGSTSNPGGTW